MQVDLLKIPASSRVRKSLTKRNWSNGLHSVNRLTQQAFRHGAKEEQIGRQDVRQRFD